ncbi:MAG: hypothetical protein B7Y45_14355, partial [Sphingomonas sp. 28-66-16]
MAIDAAHYEGREPAFVKHTFLDKYLPALIGKVCSRYDEFVYVDGFAGPWKSAAGEKFEDTSFGIALNHMTSQRLLYLSRGRPVRMRAFRDCQDFRVRAGIMGKKEIPYVPTQRACDSERAS